jgi:hypothetical protein
MCGLRVGLNSFFFSGGVTKKLEKRKKSRFLKVGKKTNEKGDGWIKNTSLGFRQFYEFLQ